MLLLYRGESFNPNFYYHAEIDIDHSFLVAGPRKKVLLVPRLNESLAKASFKGQVLVYQDPLQALSKYIKNKTVLADFTSISAKMVQKLRKVCRLKDHSIPLLEKRAKKNRNNR